MVSLCFAVYPVPLDNRPNPRNILTKLLGFQKVIDLENSVTYLPDFVKALEHLIKRDAKGIYNTVNRGGLRYPALLDIYKKHVPGFTYSIVDPKELNMVRTNLLMSTEKLEKSGFTMPDINKIIEGCVEEYLRP